ncbi:hypothetical protein KAFR_0C02630 [Kazachstania africana CBS 2517]|uniref:Uncharacterized protein n=1 Tax=Kazachstania africana (strain ATCC 22294 / BCRC 22015 / CBS 2517 / CECT 1963 / NBRC 1671 / NRRL Y-8276) TaxID=1071382 RepID=H2ASA6_KAZAF|nr:hypothetical protein KAFR_0C02630 [Kazachstania africana CBS 2517]CCF57256.1 hypothetical protein KAFR_0C02630 [Kazachstania africana CBS 2517]
MNAAIDRSGNINNNINFNNTANGITNSPADALVPISEQVQYKVQLLLHINSVLLARVIHMTNTISKEHNDLSKLPEPIQVIIQEHLKRVHSNLQCISQINQGYIRSKPSLQEPPDHTSNNPQQSHDVLAKLYLLMNRVFEFW